MLQILTCRAAPLSIFPSFPEIIYTRRKLRLPKAQSPENPPKKWILVLLLLLLT